MKYVGDKVSYVRNPSARDSYHRLVLAVLSLVLAGTSMYLLVPQVGQDSLNTGALGSASITAALMGLWYGLLSFREKERNYIPAKIGISIGLVLPIVWIVTIITGLMR